MADKQTNVRLTDEVKTAAAERASQRGLTLQGYIADLIKQDLQESRALFRAGASTFLASYAQDFEDELGEDPYPGRQQPDARSAT